MTELTQKEDEFINDERVGMDSMEFNLSDKIYEVYNEFYEKVLDINDVKEFIELLRIALHLRFYQKEEIDNIIDKYAGDNLIW